MEKSNRQRIKRNETRSAAERGAGENPGLTMVDQRPEAARERELCQMAEAPVQRIIHIGNEPNNPGAYRGTTTSVGSTQAHYGGGPMNIAAGIYANNIANSGPPVVPVPVVRGESDHSGNSMLDRTWATDNVPEIDHIVPVANLGSNSYSNARILSTRENNNNAAARPGAGATDTVAHHRIRIEEQGAVAPHPIIYNNVVNARGVLNVADHARVTAFGGLGAVIAAASGAVSNNVRITEI